MILNCTTIRIRLYYNITSIYDFPHLIIIRSVRFHPFIHSVWHVFRHYARDILLKYNNICVYKLNFETKILFIDHARIIIMMKISHDEYDATVSKLFIETVFQTFYPPVFTAGRSHARSQ